METNIYNDPRNPGQSCFPPDPLSKGLVTNYREGGGATKREGGGHLKFYPYEKGGKQVLAMLKWGGGEHNKFGVVFTR